MPELKRWILALPMVFLIHDLEELLTLERFQPVIISSFPARYHAYLQISFRQFAAAVFILFIAILLITLIAYVYPSSLCISNLLFWTVTILWMNSLTHILQAIIFGQYVPGLVSAVLLMLPYSSLFIKQLIKTRSYSVKAILIVSLAALLSSPVLIIFSLQVGKIMLP